MYTTLSDEDAVSYIAQLVSKAQSLHIYKYVDVGMILPDEIQKEDEPGIPISSSQDPRFNPTSNSVDLRSAMMTFLDPDIEPHQAAFVVCAADGGIDMFDIDLPVNSASDYLDYTRWWNLDDDREDAYETAKLIYKAGQLEQRKRDALKS